MLLKINSIEAQNKLPHRLGSKNQDGTYQVKHPPGCECQFLYSVNHAKWVSYNAMAGIAYCQRCSVQLPLPMPAYRKNWISKEVFMDLKAIENDLWAFQLKHEGCSEPLDPTWHLGDPPSAE